MEGLQVGMEVREGKRTEVRGRVKQLTANHDDSSAFMDSLTGKPSRRLIKTALTGEEPRW